jgi:hypothetical protein
MAKDVRPIELMRLLGGALAPICEAWQAGESVADLDKVEIRAALRNAYTSLSGDVEDLGANNSVAALRLRLPLMIHYGAESLASFARSCVNRAAADDAHEMLRQARDLVRVIERHLFHPATPTGENVVQISTREVKNV